jgi:hypothetical protein
MLQYRQNLRRIVVIACCVVLALTGSGVIWLCTSGEEYFSLTRRAPSDVLVVEGWIGRDSIRAAAQEFQQRHYLYLVATGGLISEKRDFERPSYAEVAAAELINAGVPVDRVIVAPTGQIERERTFVSAVAVWQALRARGMRPTALNVFTLGPHARRSRLVYEKVNAGETKVGVIGFTPPSYKLSPWWESKSRATCLLKEVVGYPFELLFNSGRPGAPPSPTTSPNFAPSGAAVSTAIDLKVASSWTNICFDAGPTPTT